MVLELQIPDVYYVWDTHTWQMEQMEHIDKQVKIYFSPDDSRLIHVSEPSYLFDNPRSRCGRLPTGKWSTCWT